MNDNNIGKQTMSENDFVLTADVPENKKKPLIIGLCVAVLFVALIVIIF